MPRQDYATSSGLVRRKAALETSLYPNPSRRDLGPALLLIGGLGLVADGHRGPVNLVGRVFLPEFDRGRRGPRVHYTEIGRLAVFGVAPGKSPDLAIESQRSRSWLPSIGRDLIAGTVPAIGIAGKDQQHFGVAIDDLAAGQIDAALPA